jgi:membrane-bound lytic murein transglycosylase
MKFIFALPLFALSVFAHGQIRTPADSILNSPAAIQACLDQVTRNGVGKPGQPPRVYTYHLVDPSELPQNPATCAETITTIENVRLALTRQIAQCKLDLANLNPIKGCTFAEPSITVGDRQITETDYCINTGTQMLALANAAPDFKSFMDSTRTAFDWYKDDGYPADSGVYKKGDMRFTAYDVPAPIAATSQRSTGTSGFPYAIYRPPPNLVNLTAVIDPKTCMATTANCGVDSITGQPEKWCLDNHNGSYSLPPNRSAINSGALNNLDLEIAYIQKIEDITLIEIEGSASLLVDGGTQPTALNYVAQNGARSYLPSVIMRCAGATQAEINGSWSAYLNSPNHVARKMEMINYSPAYIFWQPSPPAGVNGVLLTPGVSLATNRKELPTGAVTMYITARPNTSASATCAERAAMGVAQDDGGAINSNHVDIYMGEGAAAVALATINNPGLLYVAIPKLAAGKSDPSDDSQVFGLNSDLAISRSFFDINGEDKR